MENAKFILEDFQAQNGTAVKWYEVTDLEYAEDGVYGVYSDGSIVDCEGQPITDSDYARAELLLSVASACQL